MNDKLAFSRSANGTFDLSEPRIARFTAELRERVGEQGPRVPVTFMNAVSAELIRCSHDMAERRSLPFHEAVRRVVRERPSLFWLTRGVTVLDGDSTGDIEVE